MDFTGLYARFDEIHNDINMMQMSALDELLPLVKCAEVLAQKYDVVVTNPPYMAVSNAGAKVNDYVKKNFPDSKADLFAVFIERCGQMAKKNGYQAMITQHAWMFLSSFERMRECLLRSVDIVSLAHLGVGTFVDLNSKVVQSVSFVFQNAHVVDYTGRYDRLFEQQGLYEDNQEKEKWLISGKHKFLTRQEDFARIPGSPVAYWVSNHLLETFSNQPVGNVVIPRHGLATSDNNRFLKLWHEVCLGKTSLLTKCDFTKKWFPMNKGGSFRKWYGNLEWIINYENDGQEIKAFAVELYKSASRTIQNTQFYFLEGLTWSALTSGALSFRWTDVGAIFGSGAHCAFADDEENLLYGLALLNGKVSTLYLSIMSPTLNTNVDDIRATPLIIKGRDMVVLLVRECVNISKSDWDSYETSWDFKRNPLV